MEDKDGGFMATEQDLLRIDQPTDRRPDFCAEALSPARRIGLLITLILTVVLMAFSVLAVASAPAGQPGGGASLLAVLMIGGTLGLGFLVLLIFGALLANNPRVGEREQLIWYAAFLLAGPVALPVYWFMEVWPVPFEPRA